MTHLRLLASLGALGLVAVAVAMAAFGFGGIKEAIQDERRHGGGYPFGNRIEYLGWLWMVILLTAIFVGGALCVGVWLVIRGPL